MAMNSKYIVALGMAFLLASAICLSSGVVIGRMWQYSIYKTEVLDRIAKRLGVEPNWFVVRAYVHCDLLVLGMTREEVKRNLSKVGEYTEYPSSNPYTTFIFQDRFIRSELSDLVLWFDDNNRLVGKQEAGVGLDPVMISCP